VETAVVVEAEMVLILVLSVELVGPEETLVVMVLRFLATVVLVARVLVVTVEQTLEAAVVHLEDLTLLLETAVLGLLLLGTRYKIWHILQKY
jgi:hypothetical protein